MVSHSWQIVKYYGDKIYKIIENQVDPTVKVRVSEQILIQQGF